MQDHGAHHRELLLEGIKRFQDSLRPGSGELVREHLEAVGDGGLDHAAIACLAAAEATGRPAPAAVAGAVSMALIERMASVFTGLEDSVRPPMVEAWGMPRSLNAGDAMFALAQENLLSLPSELTAEERLQALTLLDEGGRYAAEALYAAKASRETSTVVLRALLLPAFKLGGLLSGAGAESLGRLEALARSWADLDDAALAASLADDPSRWLAS